jgi:hypothetical protein
MSRLRVAVIPTNGRECVEKSIAAISPQVHWITIVEAGNIYQRREYTDEKVVVLQGGEEMNISHWWNVGIDWAARYAAAAEATEWDVAVINDDVIVPPTWMCYVADDMRALDCAAACSGGRAQAPLIQRAAGPISLYDRIQGFAFVIRGESGLRAIEEFKWWFGDDDIGQRAASMGGMAMMPGCHVEHLYPGAQTTLDHQPQIGRDRDLFIATHGFAPW